MNENFHSRGGEVKTSLHFPYMIKIIRNDLIPFPEMQRKFVIVYLHSSGGGGRDEGTEWKFPFILNFFYFDGFPWASVSPDQRGGQGLA